MSHCPTIVLTNPKVKSKTTVPAENMQRISTPVNSMNAAALERKIDSGEVTTLAKIPREVAQNFMNARVQQKINGKAMTRQELATKSGLVVADINEIENGTMTLTTANKIKIRKLQTYLKMPAFTL